MTEDTPPVLYISADTSGPTTRYKATPRMHMAAKAWYPEETVDALVEALAFYGDEQAWRQPPVEVLAGEFGPAYRNQAAEVQKDRGKRARAALAALPAPDEGEQDEGEE